MSFLFPFLNFLQPGILWPELAGIRPMLIATLVAALWGETSKSVYSKSVVFLHPTFLWMLVFIAVQPLSVFRSGFLSMFDTIVYWITYPVFVSVSFLIAGSIETLRRYILGMCTGGLFVVVYGMYALSDGIGLAATGRAGAYGMYENHNDYSFIIILILPFLYTFWTSERDFFKKLFFIGGMAACVAGIFLSLSRGGMLALVLEASLIVLLIMQGKRRLLFIPVLVVCASLAIAYQWSARDANQTNYSSDDAQSSRLELWKAGWEMLKERPLLGVGSRNFSEVSQQYGELSHDNIGKNAHNTFVEILADNGLIGFGSFVMMIISLIGSLRKDMAIDNASLLHPIRLAVLVSLYSTLARTTLDAKPHDWSIFVLCAIGIVCHALSGTPRQKVGKLATHSTPISGIGTNS